MTKIFRSPVILQLMCFRTMMSEDTAFILSRCKWHLFQNKVLLRWFEGWIKASMDVVCVWCVCLFIYRWKAFFLRMGEMGKGRHCCSSPWQEAPESCIASYTSRGRRTNLPQTPAAELSCPVQIHCQHPHMRLMFFPKKHLLPLDPCFIQFFRQTCY